MREYYYLVASLPMLEFGTKAPILYQDFISQCKGQLSADDMEIIGRASIAPCEHTGDTSPTLKEWKRFEFSLRNEIARYRANKFSKDPFRHIRGEGYPDPFTAGFAQWALNQDSPIDAELSLDRARWDMIEGLKKGHYFDIDFLVAYALQLQILERWQRINSENGMEVLEGLIEKGQV